MSENVDNLVLEQLRLIRADLGELKTDLAAFKQDVKSDFDDVRGDLLGQKMMIFGLSTVIGQIDKRVEHVEEKLGIK